MSKKKRNINRDALNRINEIRAKLVEEGVSLWMGGAESEGGTVTGGERSAGYSMFHD